MYKKQQLYLLGILDATVQLAIYKLKLVRGRPVYYVYRPVVEQDKKVSAIILEDRRESLGKGVIQNASLE